MSQNHLRHEQYRSGRSLPDRQDLVAPITAAVRNQQPRDPDLAAVVIGHVADRIEAAAEQYWVVPGIVQRYAAMPDPEDIDEPLYCVSCAQVTGHDAVGKDGIAGNPHDGRPIWACKTCGQPRHEPQRDSDTTASIGYDHLPDDVSPEDIHGDEPDFGEREFQSQMDAFRERHGCFPWEQ